MKSAKDLPSINQLPNYWIIEIPSPDIYNTVIDSKLNLSIKENTKNFKKPRYIYRKGRILQHSDTDEIEHKRESGIPIKREIHKFKYQQDNLVIDGVAMGEWYKFFLANGIVPINYDNQKELFLEQMVENQQILFPSFTGYFEIHKHLTLYRERTQWFVDLFRPRAKELANPTYA